MPSLPINDFTVFPSSFSEARLSLLEDFKTLSGPVKHTPYLAQDLSGPNGEQLVTDTVWLGNADAKHVLVIISGTHGIEGFVGSAIQRDLLARLHSGQQVLPDSCAVLLIHALNPWGFAWCRRVDEQGIDLNRNYVNFSRRLPINAGYDYLQPWLGHDDTQQREAVFDNYRKTHGQRALEIAISGGQYSDPQGLFYGGSAPAHGRLVTEAVHQDYQLVGRQLIVIDLHSGLGPYGHGELICDHPLQSSAIGRSREWFGPSVAVPALGDSSSVVKQGLMDYAWHPLTERNGCFLTLEYGSYPVADLFETLRNEHYAWLSGDEKRIASAKTAMLSHFFPEDIDWRELVLVKARQTTQRAVNALTHVD